MNSTCSEILDRLIRGLESGEVIDDSLREHLKGCADCQKVLAAIRSLESDAAQKQTAADEPLELVKMDQVVATTSLTLTRSVRRRRALTLLTAGAVLIGLFLWSAWFEVGEVTFWMVMILCFSAVLIAFVGRFQRWCEEHRLVVYKRVGEGRWVSGICYGLAERFQVPVWILRALFVVMCFYHWSGLVVYLVLDVFMPIHPEDRSHLWRFKFARKVRQWFPRMAQ